MDELASKGFISQAWVAFDILVASSTKLPNQGFSPLIPARLKVYARGTCMNRRVVLVRSKLSRIEKVISPRAEQRSVPPYLARYVRTAATYRTKPSRLTTTSARSVDNLALLRVTD